MHGQQTQLLLLLHWFRVDRWARAHQFGLKQIDKPTRVLVIATKQPPSRETAVAAAAAAAASAAATPTPNANTKPYSMPAEQPKWQRQEREDSASANAASHCKRVQTQ